MRKLGKFNILKRKSKYKDLNRYLDAVYRANKELIDEKILNEEELELASNRDILAKQNKKTLFKTYIKEYMDEGYTVDQALKKASYSRVFTEYVELAQENTLEGLKEYKEAYKQFRELTKVNGRYTKIDINKFSYIGNNEYSYGDIIVSFKNSPKRVVVRKV
jgi:hypothetical protein